MQHLSFRLKPGQLLKEEIEKAAVDHQIKAGVLLSIVGGLENAVLRMAGSDIDKQTVKTWNQKFEIVSGTGTISDAGCHIHVSLSDIEGNVIGGHLKDGCKIAYTAEIILGIFDDVEFTRERDEETGFEELVVKAKT